jgi:hypothetical protein
MRRLGFFVAAIALGCATLASEAGDVDAEKPNAHAGPFRMLRSGEVSGNQAPYVLTKKFSDFREPTWLDLDGSGSFGQAALYAVAVVGQKPGVYRFVAADGRSFDEIPDPPTPVLEATEAWEGGAIDAPEIARVGDEFVLYYSAAGGIGLARSSDGISFTKSPGPVLGPSGAPAWEAASAPRAPGVVALASGEYRLFYEATDRIGEARSSDGIAWERIGEAPVLEPEIATDPNDPPFDGAGVGDPEPVRAKTAEGRALVRVYFTGRALDGSSAIGLAARFGDDGRLERAPAPALSNARAPHAPAIATYRKLTLIFVTERAGINDSSNYPAIAAGVAPADVSIPAL